MTAPRRDSDRLNPLYKSKYTTLPGGAAANQQSQNQPCGENMPLARRDDPAAPPLTARSRLREPRTYTTPEIAPRRRRSRRDEEPTLDELDRWDAEWRDEWDRGEVDDSAAYGNAAHEEDELDVAEQTRDVEWLLDALDALDDTSDDEAYEWE